MDVSLPKRPAGGWPQSADWLLKRLVASAEPGYSGNIGLGMLEYAFEAYPLSPPYP